jgi:hypothetical protein
MTNTRSKRPSTYLQTRESARSAFGNPHRVSRRRGIVLILVLAMLAILALVAVTFVAISGQAREGARHFARSFYQPKRKDLMFFALSQLVRDTADTSSAIRGHSLLKDMYGNDA